MRTQQMGQEELTEIVKRIKERREELKYSFQDLATLTGMSKSTLQRYETGGINNLPLDKLKVLAKALGTTPAYLMGWEQKEPAEDGELEEVKKLFMNLSPEKRKHVLDDLRFLQGE